MALTRKVAMNYDEACVVIAFDGVPPLLNKKNNVN